MDIKLKDHFISQWKKYFNNTDLPIIFYFSEGTGNAERASRAQGNGCLICELAKIRNGKSLYYTADELGCPGARHFLGFTDNIMDNFEYFASYGIPGKLEGERMKINPKIVLEAQKLEEPMPTRGENIIFKRWDNLQETDHPDAVIFFAKGTVLSALFMLANFDQVDPNGVIAPYGSGCSTIIYYPYLEKNKENPKAVLGMFDVSARSYIPTDTLTFAVPMEKFERMINYMDESFLITHSWKQVREKLS